MNCRFTDLRHKEVISACDGTRIGFIDDVIVDTKCATVVSIVIFGRPGFFSLVGKCQDYIIPWEKIDLIGEDTVIISCQTPKPVKKPKKLRFGAKF
nr:YlmC/YmxH family sporulation protein [uncultured Ruminococcus sp.]